MNIKDSKILIVDDESEILKRRLKELEKEILALKNENAKLKNENKKLKEGYDLHEVI